MRIHAEDPGAYAYRVVDTETGNQISWVLWADDETGEYEQMLLDTTNGTPIPDPLDPGKFQTIMRRGKIRLVNTAKTPSPVACKFEPTPAAIDRVFWSGFAFGAVLFLVVDIISRLLIHWFF